MLLLTESIEYAFLKIPMLSGLMLTGHHIHRYMLVRYPPLPPPQSGWDSGWDSGRGKQSTEASPFFSGVEDVL